MKNTRSIRRLILGLCLMSLVPMALAKGHYQFLREIPVGSDGGWDCLTVDAAAHRLYVTHATEVVVIDTTTDMVVGEIGGLAGAHDFAIAEKTGRGLDRKSTRLNSSH